MMLEIPIHPMPIEKVYECHEVEVYLKREDLIHPSISGNKYWKLFYAVNRYLEKKQKNPMLITFGGAYSNHIAAVASLGKLKGMDTLGIVRGEELQDRFLTNPTLRLAHEAGMNFQFVTREKYRNKEILTTELQTLYPHALVIPEGGTNGMAVEGIQHMLNKETEVFNYLCSAVGTGGTLAGISKYAVTNQKVIGFKVVDDDSLENRIRELSGKTNFTLVDAHEGGYGKLTEDTVCFINKFKQSTDVLLDPIYTGKMLKKLIEMVEANYFPKGSTILAFHTGGLQGIEGANEVLKKQNKKTICF